MELSAVFWKAFTSVKYIQGYVFELLNIVVRTILQIESSWKHFYSTHYRERQSE